MARYIGLDVHLDSCTLVVMSNSGRRLREEPLETNVAVLKKVIQRTPRPRYLCMEDGLLADWLYEQLEPIVDDLVVTLISKHRGCKSDAIDAWRLADMLRRNAIERQVYKQPARFRSLREAVKAYDAIQKDLVRSKLRIHALTNGCGQPVSAKLLYQRDTRADALLRIPQHYRMRAALYGKQLDGLMQCMQDAHKQLSLVAKQTPIVRRITTAPAIGIIRACHIVAAVVSPHRFRNKRQFWSYCGLGIVSRSTSNWKKKQGGGLMRNRDVLTRGLNRNRHPKLKEVFKGAAQQIPRMKEQPLARHYQQLAQTTKPKLAKLTIARRLAAAVLAMWKNQEDYDAGRPELTRTQHHS